MSNILLIEPDYKSKFPPLGLMRISSFHKKMGDEITFARGFDPDKSMLHWHRIYISSLYSWELPRTLRTIKYYLGSVSSPKDIWVGGIGATLLPGYLREQIDCTIVTGALEKPNVLSESSEIVASLAPDYGLLDAATYRYRPDDAYFVRITKGCVRRCRFCAVPLLEPEFGLVSPGIDEQVRQINSAHGEKQNLVVLDNNLLALSGIEHHIAMISDLGFSSGSKRNGRLRSVDFNQGIDARAIERKPNLARLLSKLCMKPVRLAFDTLTPSMERSYRKAVELLSEQGFTSFTSYMLYNFRDTPHDFYQRLQINSELNRRYSIRISTFPMRYIPPSNLHRNHVGPKWKWRWLRGIQCVLHATHGLVSPNPDFVAAAFGNSVDEFLEILSMPDRYIIHRHLYENRGASDWRHEFRRLSPAQMDEFLDLLHTLHTAPNRQETISSLTGYQSLVEHYYPNGQVPKNDTQLV